MGYNSANGEYHAFHATIPLSLLDFREATAGDVGNIVANGGVLASDTTPVLSGTGSTVSQQVSWATGNTDTILYQCPLPEDFTGEDEVIVELWVNSGTTDAATFTVTTSWDGGAEAVDTATDAAPSATTHKITARIAPADIPDDAAFMSIELTPAAHATNAIQLINARMLYTKKRVS